MLNRFTPMQKVMSVFFIFMIIGQLTSQAQSYSLQQAIDYALEHNENAMNAVLDIEKANYRVGEVRAIGLPQADISSNLTYNYKIRPVILPPEAAGAFGPPGAPVSDEPVALPFGVNYAGDVMFNVNQVLFSGSYIVGLQAAQTYKELTRKQATQTKRDVAEQVTKAYYGVLVNRERLNLLDANMARLDTLLRNTQILYQTGFAEEIDAKRIQVQVNNLKTQKQNTQRLVELSQQLLKFQMGLPLSENITLTDKLENAEVSLQKGKPTYNPERRIEYSILQTQQSLVDLDIKNYRFQYLPSLSAFFNYGATTGYQDFGNIFGDAQWYDLGAVGVRLNIPVFDGLSKSYKIKQARIERQKLDNAFSITKRSIELQAEQAYTNLTNNLAQLEVQQDNMDLAKEVLRVSKIKFEAGTGSNIEVTNAEADYQEALTNYYNALYDALIAQTDLKKATGELYTE